MELRIKSLRWSAGVPVAMLNFKTAKKIGVHPEDRVEIKTFGKKKRLTTIIDLASDEFVKKNEIAISHEIKEYYGFRDKEKVDVNLATWPQSLFLIKKKLKGKKLTQKEYNLIIHDIVNNSLSEAEIALFVSAMYKSGMTMREIIFLINSISNTGLKLSLKNKIIADKHCIGGVPGNRTTPIVISICAAAGLIIPKNSSKAITSAAGTADVIETIARVEFTIKEIKKIVRKTNGCMVWGGSLGIVPADERIIKIEKILKIDPESQLIASIMSKKLAAGSNFILIDIPYGKNAKVNKKQALSLKRKFEYLGMHFNKKIKCVLTEGSQPIGNGIGPALELIDVMKILDPSKKGPEDLEKKSVILAGEILEMTGKAKKGQGKKMAEEILYSGRAYKKFKEIIKAQKGKVMEIKEAKYKHTIITKKSGVILEINNKKINSLARVAGCPVDKFAGIYLHHHLNENIKKGEKILTIYAETMPRLKEAVNYYKRLKPIIIIGSRKG